MQSSERPATDLNHQFSLKRRVHIDALNIDVEEYEHATTGATHIHLDCPSDENVFMVALRTVPEDSTGVAHILEHTVLCGSERFPVRDPFFMMLRRSLNTFMNAFTSSDWTAYPFATQNRKDFQNLLEVYLDAVFFSRLDPLDFAQEGHRIEFEVEDDPESPLVYKGVVFNEMKGAMSSTPSILWDRLCYELFPNNTYHYNSGGDPECIPSLTYQDLRDFYATHYHPSNAIFLTFGNIPASEHQIEFESRVLSRFDRLDRRIEVTPAETFSEPRTATHPYAIDSQDETAKKTHHVLGWKLGESADLTAMLEAQLVSAVLMENSASPLMHYLETTPLGTSPSPLCGVEESIREMVFCCGIEGSEPEHAETFESEVLALITKVADTGISAERLEAILHQIELHQREISGDGMPYGLNLMLRALGAATHYGDPVGALDLDPVIGELRQRIQDPAYVPSLLRRLLIDNPHRIRLTVEPDPTLSAKRREAETARLAALKADLDDSAKAEILDLTAKLQARQQAEDDPSLLPRVEISDIPKTISEPEFRIAGAKAPQQRLYPTGTNGIVYQEWVAPLPAVSEDEEPLLPLLTGLMTELGLGDADYLSVQDRHSATVGGMSCGVMSRADRDNEQSASAWLAMSSKALANRAEDQVRLMADTLQSVRFDEHHRQRELLNQMRARRDESITGNGHTLAMTAACAGMSPLALRAHEQRGLEGIRRLRALDDQAAKDDGIAAIAADLESLYGKLFNAPDVRLATIADPSQLEQAAAYAASILPLHASPDHQMSLWKPTAVRESRAELWVVNTQVNFCAKAYPTVPAAHGDAPVLSVLAAYLRNGFLHRAIREHGGAYGGGASHDSSVAAFRFFSYRDPRLVETLNDFDASVSWLLDRKQDKLALEEAILSVIASLDKPGSPAGEARRHFNDHLFDRTREQREQFRAGVINTSLDDLRRVAETYLVNGEASVAVISNHELSNSDAVRDLGLTTQSLL
ncbi:MAG: insulinase family protein [Halieaceae bacterium]|jgi:Zn-dependent M16 (insulinase) family peptidase|nr:insulinase family protein [Halieaceae bacterium]